MGKVINVLYVEDEADIRSVTDIALEDEGFSLTICESGPEALEKAVGTRPDLLLLDVMMPGMDGPTLLNRLREFSHLEHTAVIFMTAKVQTSEIAQYTAMGALGVISKPFDPMSLANDIKALLNAAPSSNQLKLRKTDQIQVIQEQFTAELPVRLAAIESSWKAVRLQQAPPQDLIRQVHSVAGSAATFGFSNLGLRALAFEALLNECAANHQFATRSEAIESEIAELSRIAGQGPERDSLASFKKLMAEHHEASTDKFCVYMLEDDVSLASATASQLSHFGYEIELFTTSAELELAAKNKLPDLVLVDVRLAEGSTAGPDSVKMIREATAKNFPAIFISAHDTWEGRLNAVRAGGQAYLLKPIDFLLLSELLDTFSGRSFTPNYRVLIIDDMRLLAEHYAAVFRTANIEAEVLTDPSAVLDVLQKFSPDLILMDLYMPKVSGVEVALVIRQHAAYTNIPIVFLSTEKNLKMQLAALSDGGDDFLQKPIDDNHLLSAVLIRAKRFRQISGLISEDSLTGLLNHASLKQNLVRELALNSRHDNCTTFAMIDIDHFKQVNDRYGHPVGDTVIKSLARLLKQRLRKSDIAARYGGEEFAVILTDTNSEFAKHVITEICTSFNEIVFTHSSGNFTCSCSAGIANSSMYQSSEKLIAAADAALYEAKHLGRNRVVQDGAS